MATKKRKIIWGVIDKEGGVDSGSGDYSVEKVPSASGQYKITFQSKFHSLPAITGNQVNFGSYGQDTRDGVVFPDLNSEFVVVVVGNSTGAHEDRAFSFIAIGEGD